MLTSLLKYEFIKKWKSMRYVLLAYGLIELILLITSKVLIKRSNVPFLFIEGTTKDQNVGVPLVLALTLFFTMAFILIIFPFFEGLIRYEKDLSGKQAPLELMIPAASWKKVLSKLITAVCGTIMCGIITFFTMIIFILVMSNFDKAILDTIFNGLKEMFSSPLKNLIVLINSLFSYASVFLLIFFCTAVGKWITHKKKASGFISILVFAASLAIIIYLSIQADKYPLVAFTLFQEDNGSGLAISLSSIILEILIVATTFVGTSYIMEKRIEN